MIMAGLNKFYVDNKFPQEFRLRKVETSGNELSDVHQFDYISLRTNDSSASYGESYFDKSVRNNQKFVRQLVS